MILSILFTVSLVQYLLKSFLCFLIELVSYFSYSTLKYNVFNILFFILIFPFILVAVCFGEQKFLTFTKLGLPIYSL